MPQIKGWVFTLTSQRKLLNPPSKGLESQHFLTVSRWWEYLILRQLGAQRPVHGTRNLGKDGAPTPKFSESQRTQKMQKKGVHGGTCPWARRTRRVIGAQRGLQSVQTQEEMVLDDRQIGINRQDWKICIRGDEGYKRACYSGGHRGQNKGCSEENGRNVSDLGGTSEIDGGREEVWRYLSPLKT